MRPIRMELTNFGAYIHTVIPFEAISLGVIIGPNGAGKSTFVDLAVKVALFGSKAGPLDEFVRTGEAGFMVAYDFEAAGHVYRVVRELGKSGQKALLLRRGHVTAETRHPGFGPIEEGPSKVDPAIVAILGLEYADFCLAHNIGQGELGGFAKLDRAKRKEWVMKNLPMGVYSKLADVVKERVKGISTQRLLHEGERNAVHLLSEEDLTELRFEVVVAYATCEDRHRAITLTEQHLAEAREANAVVTQLKQALYVAGKNLETATSALDGHKLQTEATRVKLEEAQQRLTAHKATAADPLPERMDTEALVAELAVLNAQAYQVVAAETELAQTKTSLAAANDELGRKFDSHNTAAEAVELFDGSSEPCPTCGQPVDGAARDKVALALREAMQRAAAELAAASDRKSDIVDTANRQIERLDDLKQNTDPERKAKVESAVATARSIDQQHQARADLLQTIATAETWISEQAERLESETAALDAAVQRNIEAQTEVTRCQAELDNAHEVDESSALQSLSALRAEVESLQRTISKQESTLEANEKSVARLAELGRLLAELDTESTRLDLLAKAYGKNGIPARIIESALVDIEVNANAFLSQFTNGLAVSFVTQRDGKGGNLQETLDIVVSDSLGTRKIERYSGGERTRIYFAISIALARFLEARSGVAMESFVVDEPEYLDGAGVDELNVCMHMIAKSVPFVVLVSHSEAVIESYPQRMVVRKATSGSTVEVIA